MSGEQSTIQITPVENRSPLRGSHPYIHTMTVNRVLINTVMVVVHSPETDSYVLSHPPTGWGIPNSNCAQGSWLKEAALLCRKILGTPSAPSALELKKTFRVWHTDDEYLYVLLFYVEVEEGLVKRIKNESSEHFELMSTNEIQELMRTKNISPEILDILDIRPQTSVSSLLPNFVEISKDDLINPKNTPDCKLNAFINSEITESDQMALYTCYLDATFPYLKMDEISMSSFMRNLGLSTFTSDHFRSADVHNDGCIDFRGVLGFIATLKGTPKEKAGADQRCRYVFRYYDKNRDDELTLIEFEEILNEIAATKPNLNDKKMLLKSVKQGSVTHDDFAKMVGTLKLRGLSALLVDPSVPLAMGNVRSRSCSLRSSRNSMISQKLQGVAPKATPHRPSYSLGGHLITINPDGTIVFGPIQPNETTLRTDPTIIDRIAPSVSSTETFDGSSPATSITLALKFFAENVLSATEDQNKWYEGGFSDFPNALKECCNQAKLIFETEPRILKVDSPVYVIGDVHGKYGDIMNFQKHFWNFGIEGCPGSVLFLGDYVDRGRNGVEVMAYLIAQKVKNRKKIFLLRGNHEIRKVQKEHTFFNECISKFEAGREMWEVINEVMDRMPLAALIDDEVFCCHGGIPKPSQCEALDDINKILCPLPNPFDSKLAWALLWNDPQKVGYNSEKGKKSSDGFSMNSRRKTGHTFDKSALNSFIEKHKLSYVVRAHEVQDAGFQVDLDNRLITVFSSSSYRGNNNSGCVLVQKNKLRILTLSPALARV